MSSIATHAAPTDTAAPASALAREAAPPVESLADHASQNVALVITLLRAFDRGATALRTIVEHAAAMHGLSESQLLALWTCHEAASTGVGQSELAARIGVSPSQASALVEQLRLTGYLIAQRPAADRRRQVWTISEQGTAVVESALADLSPAAVSFAAAISAVEYESLCGQLARIVAAVKSSPTVQPHILRVVCPLADSPGATARAAGQPREDAR